MITGYIITIICIIVVITLAMVYSPNYNKIDSMDTVKERVLAQMNPTMNGSEKIDIIIKECNLTYNNISVLDRPVYSCKSQLIDILLRGF